MVGYPQGLIYLSKLLEKYFHIFHWKKCILLQAKLHTNINKSDLLSITSHTSHVTLSTNHLTAFVWHLKIPLIPFKMHLLAIYRWNGHVQRFTTWHKYYSYLLNLKRYPRECCFNEITNGLPRQRWGHCTRSLIVFILLVVLNLHHFGWICMQQQMHKYVIQALHLLYHWSQSTDSDILKIIAHNTGHNWRYYVQTTRMEKHQLIGTFHIVIKKIRSCYFINVVFPMWYILHNFLFLNNNNYSTHCVWNTKSYIIVARFRFL